MKNQRRGHGSGDHAEQERRVAAGGAGGARRRVPAAARLPAARALRVVAHRDGHQPGHPGPHAAPPAQGQPAHPLHHPEPRRQGALRHALQGGHRAALRRGHGRVAAGARRARLGARPAPAEAARRRLPGLLPPRWFQQVPDGVLGALRDQRGQLVLAQQLAAHLRAGPGRPAHQLRLLRRGVGPGAAQQCHRVGRQPCAVQPAGLPRPDPALPLPRLRQGLHQPGRARQVRHQVHPQRHAQPAQRLRAWGRVHLQADPHLRPLEPEPLPVLPRGHQLHRRGALQEVRRPGALPGGHQPLGDGHGGLPDAEDEPVAQRRLRLRQEEKVQHLTQLQLHGAAAGLRADAGAEQPVRQPQAQRAALLLHAPHPQPVPPQHPGVHVRPAGRALPLGDGPQRSRTDSGARPRTQGCGATRARPGRRTLPTNAQPAGGF